VRELKTKRVETVTALIEEMRSRVEAARRVVVVTHIDPDGDAIGTQLAFGEYLKALGKEYVLVRDSDIPGKYGFLPGIDTIIPVASLNGDLSFDLVLVLECPSHLRMGTAARLVTDSAVIINVDHHPDSTVGGDVDWVDTGASSVGEMAYEYFHTIGFRITPDIATQLYTAILTDTGRFRFESTTPRTMNVAGELVAHGADPRTICDKVYFDLDPATMRLTGRVLNGISFYADGRICVLTLTRAMMEDVGAVEGSVEGLVDYSLLTKGVVIGVLVKEVSDDLTKLSLRSRGGVNVAEVAARMGGGGHPNAAGGRLVMGLEQARKKVIAVLEASL
jgi:phosphoesterase RecJ-like protein